MTYICVYMTMCNYVHFSLYISACQTVLEYSHINVYLDRDFYIQVINLKISEHKNNLIMLTNQKSGSLYVGPSKGS